MVLGLVVTLGDGATPRGVWVETLRAQRARLTLGSARNEKRQPCPARVRFRVRVVAPPGQRTSSPARVEDEHLRLKQLRGGHRPVNRRDIDGQLRPVRGVTQLGQHVPAIADAINRETGDIVAVGVLFPRDQLLALAASSALAGSTSMAQISSESASILTSSKYPS